MVPLAKYFELEWFHGSDNDRQKLLKTKIKHLPLIDAAPSNYGTIKTSLRQAVAKTKQCSQKICVFTADQPIYWKARDIVASADPSSDLRNVVVRLGGFHLLMSFLGAVGYIMSGSGIEEVLQIIYAANCVDKLLSGHAYSRAIRAHFLVAVSLGKIIMNEIELTDEERDSLDSYLNDVDRTIILTAENDNVIQTVRRKFDSKLKEMKTWGPTAQLWVQYFELIILVKQFIEAERTGNWELHLNTVQQIIHIFHASGRHLHAKSSQLYFQDMLNLKNIMPPDEFEKFAVKGYFTMKFNDQYWASFFSDLAIECFFMKYFKLCGSGLTHGRGLSENRMKTWVLGMPYLMNVCSQLENFCNVACDSSEQHIDLRTTRISRDNSDTEALDSWFARHPPFVKEKCIYSILLEWSGVRISIVLTLWKLDHECCHKHSENL